MKRPRSILVYGLQQERQQQEQQLHRWQNQQPPVESPLSPSAAEALAASAYPLPAELHVSEPECGDEETSFFAMYTQDVGSDGECGELLLGPVEAAGRADYLCTVEDRWSSGPQG